MSMNSTIWDQDDVSVTLVREPKKSPYFSFEVVWHGQGYDANVSIEGAKILVEQLQRAIKEVEGP